MELFLAPLAHFDLLCEKFSRERVIFFFPYTYIQEKSVVQYCPYMYYHHPHSGERPGYNIASTCILLPFSHLPGRLPVTFCVYIHQRTTRLLLRLLKLLQEPLLMSLPLAVL